MRVFNCGKIHQINSVSFCNPYCFTIVESKGVCTVYEKSFGSFQIKEKLDDIVEIWNKFQEDFEKDFLEWKRTVTPEHLKLLGL